MKRLLRAVVFTVLTLSGAAALAQNSSAVTIERQSATALAGHIKAPAISFSGSLADEALVRFTLRSGAAVVVTAEIDYRQQTVQVRSTTGSQGRPAPITVSDLARFQRLLALSASHVDGSTRLGGAFFSLMNLLSTAPPGRPLRIGAPGDTPRPQAATSLCGQIGGGGVATFLLGGTTISDPVTIGPACFAPPALGRCGAADGPDTGIGNVQRFTQECLNHDQCCAATGNRLEKRFGFRVNVCGRTDGECEPEFSAAANSFFFAPDCGAVAGQWTDLFGATYRLAGGGASGTATAFAGTVRTANCGLWDVTGTQTGQAITLTATNPAGAIDSCAASFTLTGRNSTCDAGGGTFTNSDGGFGSWTWTRGIANAVPEAGRNAGPSPTAAR